MWTLKREFTVNIKKHTQKQCQHSKLEMFKGKQNSKVTLTSLASLESAKAGYCSSYRWTACWAFSESTHRWQSAARKKYSLALYLSRELSKAEAATCTIFPHSMNQMKEKGKRGKIISGRLAISSVTLIWALAKLLKCYARTGFHASHNSPIRKAKFICQQSSALIQIAKLWVAFVIYNWLVSFGYSSRIIWIQYQMSSD